MRILLHLLMIALPAFGALYAEPVLAGSKWSRLGDVEKNLVHLRRSGLFPVVTGLQCRFKNNDPRIRFTYKFSKTMVRYNNAWSIKGKAVYDKYAQKYLTAKSQIISCSSGDFYYGVQNLVK